MRNRDFIIIIMSHLQLEFVLSFAFKLRICCVALCYGGCFSGSSDKGLWAGTGLGVGVRGWGLRFYAVVCPHLTYIVMRSALFLFWSCPPHLFRCLRAQTFVVLLRCSSDLCALLQTGSMFISKHHQWLDKAQIKQISEKKKEIPFSCLFIF